MLEEALENLVEGIEDRVNAFTKEELRAEMREVAEEVVEEKITEFEEELVEVVEEVAGTEPTIETTEQPVASLSDKAFQVFKAVKTLSEQTEDRVFSYKDIGQEIGRNDSNFIADGLRELREKGLVEEEELDFNRRRRSVTGMPERVAFKQEAT